MGCYDTVAVPCPKCGEKYYAQSKSGPCELLDFELAACPADVLVNINRHAPFECEACGCIFSVEMAPRVTIWEPRTNSAPAPSTSTTESPRDVANLGGKP